jgi:hypothetical protein
MPKTSLHSSFPTVQKDSEEADLFPKTLTNLGKDGGLRNKFCLLGIFLYGWKRRMEAALSPCSLMLRTRATTDPEQQWDGAA